VESPLIFNSDQGDPRGPLAVALVTPGTRATPATDAAD